MADSSLVQSVVAFLSVVAAMVSAKAALDTVRETRASGVESAERNRIAEGHRLALIRPHVVVYIRPGRTHGDFRHTSLYVHNVGPGAARGVEVQVIKGGDHLLMGHRRLDEWGVVQKGVAVIPPGDAVVTGFTLPGGDAEPLPEILMEVRYRDIEGRQYQAERFEISQDFLIGTIGPAKTKSSSDPEERIARSLEEISKKLAS